MLLSSNFILNRVSTTEEFSIYPFIHSFSNIRDSQQQLTPIRIPDVLPSNLPPTADFSMVAGDFIEVYGDNPDHEGAWDVVATCFFIDTAKNIIRYLEIIHQILKPGGTWINIGKHSTAGGHTVHALLTLVNFQDRFCTILRTRQARTRLS